MKFDQINWNRAFFKTYYEKRSFGHLLVNFNRIWVIHIAMYWFYTAYNSPTVYNGEQSVAMRWSATALGGAVATVIMICATLAEFSYIPTTWNNTSHLTRRLLFLIVTLILTAGPTFYVAIAESSSPGGQLALILGIVQFFISAVATLLFAILPSGRMFGDRVAGKSRKYLASQTFTASYPSLKASARIASVSLWILVFTCKFVESYFFLTQGFRNPILVMVGMKVQGCNDKYFGNNLCRNQAAFTLTIMYLMDLVLYFLDTFLWWIIWNTVFSIARSFVLGLSIWTPWKDIYLRLPKRIFSKLLATSDMEVKYKPKVRLPRFRSLCTSHSPRICRSSSPKFGTRLSSPCTANTFCRLSTFRSYSITRWIRAPMVDVLSVRQPFSLPNTTEVVKANSLHLVVRRNVESRSLPNLLRPLSPNPFLSMPCLRSPC